jgi:ElaA protein
MEARVAMELVSKYFNELTTTELYEILKARVAVFVVEQTCPYQEVDGNDYDSLHVFYEEEGQVKAYLRSFFISDDVVQMGRVLTIDRGTGLGGRLLREGIEQIREKQHPRRIYIEAQCYATGYYEREGFEICSEEFLEDGIPHVQMILDL